MYDETDVTWSSIEKCYLYSKVNWHIGKNGIPRYTFYDDYGNKINIDINNYLKSNE